MFIAVIHFGEKKKYARQYEIAMFSFFAYLDFASISAIYDVPNNQKASLFPLPPLSLVHQWSQKPWLTDKLFKVKRQGEEIHLLFFCIMLWYVSLISLYCKDLIHTIPKPGVF